MARNAHIAGHDHDHGSLLRLAGLRVTPVRLGVLRTLCATHEVLSADQIVEALASAGDRKASKGRKPDRVTVYRTLHALVDAGIAHKMDPGDRVFRFGLTGDHAAHTPSGPGPCGCDRSEKCEHLTASPAAPAHLEPNHGHPHFLCETCGKVECLEDTEVVVKPRPNRSKASIPPRIRRQEILLKGTCGNCVPPRPPAA